MPRKRDHNISALSFLMSGTCASQTLSSLQAPTQQPTTLAPGIPVISTTCPKGFTLQSDGSCLNTDPSIGGPPSNVSTCPSGKPAPEDGVCSISADGTTHACYDGSILPVAQPCQSPTSICPAQSSGLGGGEIVTNLNNCPAECPNGLIKTASGCPSSSGSYSGSSKSSTSSSSSGSSTSTISKRNIEMNILGYIEGCQGNTRVFNSTIEDNKIFKNGYGARSDCSDDLMSNVQQILNPTSAAATPVLAKSHHASSSSSSTAGSQSGLGSAVVSNSTNSQGIASVPVEPNPFSHGLDFSNVNVYLNASDGHYHINGLAKNTLPETRSNSVYLSIDFQDKSTGTTVKSVSGNLNGPIEPGQTVPFDIDTGYAVAQGNQLHFIKVMITYS